MPGTGKRRLWNRIGLAAGVSALAASAGAQAQLPSPIPVPVEDHARAVECLSLAVAYEAGNESLAGQQAVAEVVLNRVHTAHFPKTVCDVVFAGSTRRTGCQFTFTCDGSLLRRLSARMLGAARIIAEDALAGRAPLQVPGATHYHADYVTPYWAPTLARVAKIGAHIFYQARNGAVALLPGAGVTAARTGAEPKAPAVFAPWGLGAAAIRQAAPAPTGQSEALIR